MLGRGSGMAAAPSGNAPLTAVGVDTGDASRKVYLLKVPEHVFAACTAAKAGEHMGEVEIGIPTNGSASEPVPMRFSLPALPAGEEMTEPAKCEVRVQPRQREPIYAFSERKSGMFASGTIVSNGVMQVPLGAARLSMLQKRKEAAEKPKRMLQQTEHTRKTAIAAVDHTRAAKAPRIIRQKMPEEDLRAKLLELFTKDRPLWKAKDLEAATMQAPEHLKKVLEQICDYHTSGEQRTMWELKQQYRG